VQKKIIPLVIGVLFAFLATYMIKAYFQQQRKLFKEEAQEEAKKAMFAFQQNQVEVFAAITNISAGTIITSRMIDKGLLPRQQAHPQAVRFFGEIEGKQAARIIRAGDQIIPDMLKEKEGKERKKGAVTLSMLVPPGKRAIAVSVDNISLLAGMINPGDRVDVIGTITPPKETKQNEINATLFQNVLIIAVGEELIGMTEVSAKGTRGASSLVTLVLSPKDAGILSFIAERGKIRLSLRSQLDEDKEIYSSVTWDDILQFFESKGTLTISPSRKPGKEVEVYRGLNKETIELR